MLRIGKNQKADQPESEHMSDNPANQYNTSQQTYPPYQNQNSPAADQTYRQGDTASTSRPVTESESLARDIKEGILTGFVGNGTSLEGEATFKGMLRVDGHLSGQVNSDGGTLIVGNNGQVDANIAVAVADIRGTVIGNIIASQRVELGRAAKVKGDIETPSLVIEQGATFDGKCVMAQPREAQEKKNSASASGNGVLNTTGIKPTTDTAATTKPATDATATRPPETAKATTPTS